MIIRYNFQKTTLCKTNIFGEKRDYVAELISHSSANEEEISKQKIPRGKK